MVAMCCAPSSAFVGPPVVLVISSCDSATGGDGKAKKNTHKTTLKHAMNYYLEKNMGTLLNPLVFFFFEWDYVDFGAA